MIESLLIINSGSTSLKFGIYQNSNELKLIMSGMIESMSTSPDLKIYDEYKNLFHHKSWDQSIKHTDGLMYLIDFLGKNTKFKFIAAGHRVVLGGDKFDSPTLLNPDTIKYLESLSVFVPSHQPFNLAGINAINEIFPELPQVAVFDSSFHQTIPEIAKIYPLDKELRSSGVKHWGFHGISYDYITSKLKELNILDSRVVIAHLGGGASISAIKNGKCIDTSMQFSGLTGLPMATRSGDIPADVILYLLKQNIINVEDLEKSLYKKSGLLGLSENSEDMRIIQECKTEKDTLAFNYFIYSLNKFIGSYIAHLEGIDALVFTAGIGENSHIVRSSVCQKLKWIGVEIDESKNKSNNFVISSNTSKVKVYVIPTNEEYMIAKHTSNLV